MQRNRTRNHFSLTGCVLNFFIPGHYHYLEACWWWLEEIFRSSRSNFSFFLQKKKKMEKSKYCWKTRFRNFSLALFVFGSTSKGQIRWIWLQPFLIFLMECLECEIDSAKFGFLQIFNVALLELRRLDLQGQGHIRVYHEWGLFDWLYKMLHCISRRVEPSC